MSNYLKDRKLINTAVDRENIEKIVALACKLGDITKEELMSDSRQRLIGDVRMCVGNLLRRVFGLTSMEAGKYLNRDHSTILHYEREHGSLMLLNYYKKMYTKCVHAATNLSEDIECTEFSSSQIIKELKKENATLLRRIDKLKQDMSDYRKLKNKLQSLLNLV